MIVGICALATSSFAQSAIAPLKHLRDQLVATNGLRDADVVAVVSERALNDTAQRMAGLEIKLASGAVMKITSASLELKPAAALVKLGVQVDPSSKFKTAHFRLWGKLGSGEVRGANLRLPFQLTDVAFGTEDSKNLSLMKLLLRDWLLPGKWNAALPPLEIPLQLSPVIDVPAATFESNGEMLMTIETPAYQVKVEFWLTAFVVLDGRAVVAMSLRPPPEAPQPSGNILGDHEDDASLSREIAQLAQHLTLSSDVSIRVRKSAINSLLANLAAARDIDLTVKLNQGRLRTEEIDALVGKISNYTDVESGDGKADVARLSVEDISEARLSVRLAGQGELNVKVKGREYGLPYKLSPRGRFSINDELVPLNIVSRNERIVVRAAAGAVVPVRVIMTIEVAGHPINFTRTVKLQADQWLKDFELPAIIPQEIQLPRKIVVGKNSELNIASRETSRYTISNLRIEAKAGALEFSADIR